MAQEHPRGVAGRPPNGGTSRGGYADGWTMLSHLITGVVLFGGAGWALDTWLDLRWLFLPVGLLVGVIMSFALIYVRFVYAPDAPGADSGGSVDPTDRKEQRG